MFVYALEISGTPQDQSAFELLKAKFDVPDSALDTPSQRQWRVIVFQPDRNSGELFFEQELKALGQTFTELSRAGLTFMVLRQRFDGDFKRVADYTDQLKTGRKAWREEKIRVEAASESLESFLTEEASPEDMEVLRPLFPNDVNTLLTDNETGVMKGSGMLQQSFLSLKGADARRIFYQMQLLHEKRSGKWRLRLGCSMVSIYFLMAVVIGVAIYSWLNSSIALHGLIAAPIAFVLSLIPIISSVLAYVAATSIWDWPPIYAFPFFFWYYLPMMIPLVALIMATIKGNGKTQWDALIGRNKSPSSEEQDD